MKPEKRWIALFCVLVSFWLTAVGSTLYQWIFGLSPLVNSDINLYYFTLPLRAIYLFYFFTSMFISCLFLVTFTKVKNHQMQKIIENRKISNLVTENNDKSIQVGNFANELCSIIIPSRNEENVIGKTVRHCLLQTHHDIEVIVICHNCDDRTFYEAQAVKDNRVRAFDLRTKETGKGIALNEGVKRANGKYILILDSDAMLSRDFIDTALPLFDYNIGSGSRQICA